MIISIDFYGRIVTWMLVYSSKNVLLLPL